VAIALDNDEFEGESELLHFIRDHPKADARTLRYVDRATPEDNSLDQEEEFF
jgi:ribosomal 50S subunit-associated protein YjgA (DUF615 family)